MTKPHQSSHLIAGFAGGGISTILLFPLDLIKVRLQANENLKGSKELIQSSSFMRTFRNIIRYEGILGLYQGIGPAILGSSASWGGYFFFYEGIKEWYKCKSDSTSMGPIENFAAACGSGAIMVGLTNPIWLIKTRMQLQMKGVQVVNTQNVKAPYSGMANAFQTIVREEGILALYKGAVPALMLVSHGGIQVNIGCLCFKVEIAYH